MSNSNKECPNYNCLFRIPNTDDNLAIIKEIRKMMKDYGTRWRIIVRGRKPKTGHKYSYGGGLKIEHAEELGIYIAPKPEIAEKEWKSRQRYWDALMKQSIGNARKEYLDSLEDIQYYIDEASDMIARKINDE
tara:strand:+ start:155 stop:553 length:399 start_codon:yes stop_codon:yes gene_type:complete